MVNRVILFLPVLLISACARISTKELPLSDFIHKVERKESGVFTKTIDRINYVLQYKPLDYVIIREMNEDIRNADKLKALKKEYGKFDYYTLEINVNDFRDEILKYNLRSEEEYNERVNYYSFKFQNDLKMVEKNDTIPCTAYHFERNYGLSPKVRFLLAFRKGDEKNERTFICNEQYLGNATVKINIDPNTLNEIPTLKLD